jgi:hypothetical protein
MLKILDDLVCQMFHGNWAALESFSRQGAWRCTKPGCPAQARVQRHVLGAQHPIPLGVPVGPLSGRRHGAARAHNHAA